MNDEELDGIAHELWALAQGRAPIEDVVAPMLLALTEFALQLRTAERERIAQECWEHRGMFASDMAARAFADLVRQSTEVLR